MRLAPICGAAPIHDVDQFRAQPLALHGDVDGGHAATDNDDLAADRQAALSSAWRKLGDVVDAFSTPGSLPCQAELH